MTKVKICGITSVDDARLAAELGAWAVGLIFHPSSPRAVDLADAEAIGAELKREVLVTGVFANAPLDELAAVAERCSLALLQLHGEEGQAYCREAARRTGAKVMKAVRIKDAAAVRSLGAYRDVDYHLLDAHVHGTRGGTGETFPWELARSHRGPVPVVLSGGLTPENVGAAIAAARPFAVDSATGTEAEPGVKDPARVRAFFRAVEQADGDKAAA